MLTVTIVSVLAGVGVPAFTSLSLDHHRSALVNELLATLLLARSEAVKLGQDVVVCGVDDRNGNGVLEPAERHCAGRDWTDGWLLGVWTDTDGDDAVGSNEMRVLREHVIGESGRLRVTTGNFAAFPSISPAGTAVLKPFDRRSANGTITICDRRGSTAARAIIISPNGRARVSSHKADGTPLSCS